VAWDWFLAQAPTARIAGTKKKTGKSMKFYDFALAPSPTKVRIFIAEKGIVVPTVVVNIRNREQQASDYREKVASATVPALELDDGTILSESHAICRYLELMNPQPNLMGEDAKEQALVVMWHDISTLEGYLAAQEVYRNEQEMFAGRALPGPLNYDQIPALVARGRVRIEHFFDKLEKRLGESEYIALDRYTYADIVTYVNLGFCTRATGKDPSPGRENLSRWRDSITARPGVIAATS
jgi:glutathione S-transferase